MSGNHIKVKKKKKKKRTKKQQQQQKSYNHNQQLFVRNNINRSPESVTIKYEPPHDKSNKMTVRPAKIQISLASAQSDQSFRCPHEEGLGP